MPTDSYFRTEPRRNAPEIRIFFCIWADAANVNAQSLNARDIALRLDAQRFTSTFLLSSNAEPDARLACRKNIHFVRLPLRLRSVIIAAQALWGFHDILFYPPMDPRTMTWYRMLRFLGRRKKIIATVEGSVETIHTFPHAVKESFLRTLKEADSVYAISPSIAEGLFKEWRINASMLPIGVDTKAFTPADRGGRSLPVKVLYVGAIYPRKQVHLLLDFAEKLGSSQAEFHIIGDTNRSPAYRDELVRSLATRGLRNVRFHGSLSQSEVAEWMRQSDVFGHPSRFEGTPKVTLEAAASGLPCVVFADYQTPSVINGVTGFQVKTPDEMLERLRQLIGNRELRLKMGDAAVEHAQQFDWNIVAGKWAAAFEELAGERPM